MHAHDVCVLFVYLLKLPSFLSSCSRIKYWSWERSCCLPSTRQQESPEESSTWGGESQHSLHLQLSFFPDKRPYPVVMLAGINQRSCGLFISATGGRGFKIVSQHASCQQIGNMLMLY